MKNLLIFTLSLLVFPAFAQEIGQQLPPWREGYLDLHHINTGRGDAAFYILPDGTTFLLDAGELSPTPSPRTTEPHPNGSKPPHAWMVQYVKKFMPPVSEGKFDYALITHFHNDHFGGYYEGVPQSRTGKYFRSGMTGVGDDIPIRTMIDRGYPDYAFPERFKQLRVAFLKGDGDVPDMAKGMVNYWNFVDYHVRHSGMKAQSLKAGRDDQIVLVHKPRAYSNFKVKNIKSNGTIWTGKGTETFEHFPSPADTLDITENQLSNAIRIDYGEFRYYTGGDCPGLVPIGGSQWQDLATPVAKAVGSVDVAVLDHHGNRDSHNEFNVRTLSPRVWIGQSWSVSHPGVEVLRRMVSKHLYPGPRDLFTTNMMEANKMVIGSLVEQSYKSMEGHIVVRVLPGGNSYYVIILNDENEANEITGVFGPYETKKK